MQTEMEADLNLAERMFAGGTGADSPVRTSCMIFGEGLEDTSSVIGPMFWTGRRRAAAAYVHS